MTEHTVHDLVQRTGQMEEHMATAGQSFRDAGALRRQKAVSELRSQPRELQDSAKTLRRLHW